MEEQIKLQLKEAQLAKDELKTSVLRMLLSEIHNASIQKSGEVLSDDEITSVVQRELKKRREAFEAFTKGGRDESAQKEQAEAEILESFLPAQLSDEELTEVVEGAITELGASSIQDMGRVMGAVMGKVGSQAEPARVSSIVKGKING